MDYADRNIKDPKNKICLVLYAVADPTIESGTMKGRITLLSGETIDVLCSSVRELNDILKKYQISEIVLDNKKHNE